MSKSTLSVIAVVILAGALVLAVKFFFFPHSAENRLLSHWSQLKNLPSCLRQFNRIEATQTHATPSGKILLSNRTGQLVSTISLQAGHLVHQTTDPQLKPRLDQLFAHLQASGSSYPVGIFCQENDKKVVKQYQLQTDPSKSDYLNFVISKLDELLGREGYGIRWKSNQ